MGSSHVSHSLTSGEGGVIVTDDDEINHLCRSIKNHGRSGNGVFDVFKFPNFGFNGKMSNIHASLALGCTRKMYEYLTARKEVVKKISYQIGDHFGVVDDKIVPHSFPIKLNSEKK